MSHQPWRYRAVVLRDLPRGVAPPAYALSRARAEPCLAGLTREQLTRIYALMWCVSRGAGPPSLGRTRAQTLMPAVERCLRLAGEAVPAFGRGRWAA